MKKKINLMKLALSCAVGGTLFFSCNKDESKGKPEQDADIQVHQQDIQVEQRILAFKQRCKFYKENPQIKTGGLLSLDEAIWNMEASLNYTYSHSTAISDDQHLSCSEIPLTLLDGDSIDYTAVSASYYQMIDSLVAFYNSLTVPGKKVLIMDVCKLPANGTSPLKLKFTSIIGPEELAAPAAPYGLTDYWFYGYGQGKCGQYYGSGFGSDAASEIEKLQGNYTMPQIPGYHLFYTNVETLNIIGDMYANPNDVVLNDNMYDFLMFNNKSDLPNFHDCLTPEEMDFYSFWTYYVLTDPSMVRTETNPPLKQFISVKLKGVDIQFSSLEIYSHFAEANYGIPYYSYDPCFPMAAPLKY